MHLYDQLPRVRESMRESRLYEYVNNDGSEQFTEENKTNASVISISTNRIIDNRVGLNANLFCKAFQDFILDNSR